MDDIFWITSGVKGIPDQASSRLAIVLRPRGDDWLEGEMVRMRRGGIDTMVSMLEPDEADALGLAEEGLLAVRAGMQYLSFPIADTKVPPNPYVFRAFVSGLAERACAGQRIGFHCRGSIGRSTIAAACTLAHLGWQPKVALEAIEAARGCPVPDTREQRAWIMRYEARP